MVIRGVRRLRRLIPTRGTGRAVAILASGSILSQVALVVAAPIITRLYKPADLGVYGAAISIVSIILWSGSSKRLMSPIMSSATLP